MGACASKTNDQVEETNMENEHEAGFTSPVHEPMSEYHDQVVDGVVDEVLPQQYEVVENVTGNVDPISHLDAEYQNAGFTVTEQPVTHIMVREGVYMNRETNEILYDTALFPNGAQDVAQPMDPAPARGYDADAYEPMPAGNNYEFAAHPVSYDQTFAPEEAAFAPEHAAAQENNLMVGVAMQQAPQTQLEEPAAQADEVPPPEAEQEAEPEQYEPVAENKKRRKKKSKKSRGWGW